MRIKPTPIKARPKIMCCGCDKGNSLFSFFFILAHFRSAALSYCLFLWRLSSFKLQPFYLNQQAFALSYYPCATVVAKDLVGVCRVESNTCYWRFGCFFVHNLCYRVFNIYSNSSYTIVTICDYT